MIYFEDDSLVIRTLTPEDNAHLVAEERAQGWHSTPEKLAMRLRHEAEGKCITLCAVLHGEPVGYVHVYPQCVQGALGGRGWPEIVDFAVLEKARRQGVGSRLMDAAEQIAARYADTVYLAVGLHSGYGSAQRMYVKRGYVPDGSGVWFEDRQLAPYTPCENNDDLVLYLSKRLSGRGQQAAKA